MGDSISNNLDEIRDLLDLDSDYDGNKDIKHAWFVGATGNNDDGVYTDFSDLYIREGRWQNRWSGDSKYDDLVKSMEVGDRIAIKAAYTKKNGLPFNNNGKKVGVMGIKAIGTITANSNDGKNIQVDWEKVDPIREWYGSGVLMQTVHFVENNSYIRKALLNFTFKNADQDYSICEEQYADIDELESIDDVDSIDDCTGFDKADRVEGAENRYLYGVPGSGKSYKIKTEYCDDERYMERVVFHPDYTYSDFIGQILPKTKDGIISYPFIPGPFTRILKKAYRDPKNMYFLIIEEINRGNAPAIFGEVFQLLDRNSKIDGGKIGESTYGINNSDIALTVYGNEEHPVRIPSNLTILATMNTADQNVFTLDTAFKRRWKAEIIPNRVNDCKHATQRICGRNVQWAEFANKINDMIIELGEGNLSSEDNRLGGYFVNEEDIQNPSDFAEKVLMYLWNDAFKFDRDKVFVSEYKTLEQLIEGFKSKYFEVFLKGFNFDNSIYEEPIEAITE